MNAKKIIVLVLVMCLMGCSHGDDKKIDDMLAEMGEGTNISNQSQGENCYNDIYRYGESDKGFYYVNRQQMYYFDKENDSIILMCTKPECDHILYKDSQRVYSCEALYANNFFVQVYDGKLYADAELERGEPQSIIVSNLDGTEKAVAVSNIEERIEKEIERFNSGGIYGYVSSLTWRIYDGIVYVFTNMSAEVGKNNYFFIDKYDLKSGEYLGEVTSKILEGNQGSTSEVYKHENKMLIMLSIGTGEGERHYMYIEVDITNGNMIFIDVPKTVSETLYNGRVIYQTYNDNIYMMNSNSEAELCIELNEFEKKSGVIVTRIGNYLFVTPIFFASTEAAKNGYYTKVYDSEFDLIDTIQLPEELLPIAGYNEILFVMRSRDQYYGMDASQIGAGNAELIEYTMQ